MTPSRLPGSFFWRLVSREIRADYLENLTGFAWLVLQPLALLAVYTFVFSTIFQARIPDAQGMGFVPYLAVAFWPWTAFSEAVLRSSNAIAANAELIGKVAIRSELLPLSTVTATFAMHMAGYLAVLLVLNLTGTDIHWTGMIVTLPVLVLLYLFACALGLMLSSLRVFVRDLAQILPPVMTFWFFMTPILYSTSLLPESLQAVMAWNPMTWFVGRMRDSLLFGEVAVGAADGFAVIGTLSLAWLCARFFRRFSGHFEDFL